MLGGAAVGPGDERVAGPVQGLGQGGRDGVVGADDHRAGERWVEALLPTVSPSPVGLERKVRSTVWGSRPHAGGVGQPAAVGRGQPQLDPGRVLVVGRRERAAGHPVEVLDGVGVAVGWGGAVVQDQRPGQPGRRQRAVLGVAGMAGEADGVADGPGARRCRGVDDRRRWRVPRRDRHRGGGR